MDHVANRGPHSRVKRFALSACSASENSPCAAHQHHVVLTRLDARCTKPCKSEITMKEKNQDPAKGHTNNSRYQQEDTASHDYEKQREAGAREAEANAKKLKKPGK
jgi:hypothetical protein